MRIIASGYFKAKDAESQAFIAGLGNKYGLHLERLRGEDHEVELWSDEYFREDVEFFAGLISGYLVSGEIFCEGVNDDAWKMELNPDTHVFETKPGATVYITKDELNNLNELLEKISEDHWNSTNTALKNLVDQLNVRIWLRSETIPGMAVGMISYKEFDPSVEKDCSDAKKKLTKAERFETFSEVLRSVLKRNADEALGTYFDGMSDIEIAEALDASSYDELCKDLVDTFLDDFQDLSGVHWEHIISDKQEAVCENRKKNEKSPANEARTKYPVGTIVVLDHMGDPQAPAPGTRGKVVFVDDIGQIHVKWATGSSLALIPGVDEFHVV